MAESLAAEAGLLSKKSDFVMPAVFQEPTEEVVGRFNTPYLVFAHKNRQDEHAKLVGQFGNVNEGDMFLIEGNKITKLETAKLGLIKLKQYWVEKNAAGQVLRSSFTEKPWPWAEHMDAVVLVYLDDRIVVANVNPHTTKCSGFKTLADALLESQTPEWGDKSPAFRETLQINQPFMRFFGEVTLSQARTSRKSGLPYRVTQCVIKPTTNTEVRLLTEFIASPDNNKTLQDAADRFTYQLKETESKLVK